MEAFAKIAVVLSCMVSVVISFIVGWKIIRKCGDIAKPWVDLAAVSFGAISFIAAVFSVSSLLKNHDGKWLLDYPLIGEPSFFTFLLPLSLAFGLGLSLAKRCSDLKRARKR